MLLLKGSYCYCFCADTGNRWRTALVDLCQVSIQPEQFLVPVHYVVAQTIVPDRSEGGNEQWQCEKGPFNFRPVIVMKLEPLPLHFLLTCLAVRHFIADFMLFMTVKVN